MALKFKTDQEAREFFAMIGKPVPAELATAQVPAAVAQPVAPKPARQRKASQPKPQKKAQAPKKNAKKSRGWSLPLVLTELSVALFLAWWLWAVLA